MLNRWGKKTTLMIQFCELLIFINYFFTWNKDKVKSCVFGFTQSYCNNVDVCPWFAVL